MKERRDLSMVINKDFVKEVVRFVTALSIAIITTVVKTRQENKQREKFVKAVLVDTQKHDDAWTEDVANRVVQKMEEKKSKKVTPKAVPID